MTHKASYIGHLGSMVPLACLAGLTEVTERTATVHEGLAGRRRVYRSPASRRAWACDLTGTPTDLGTLAEVEATMPGPLWMVTCPAQISNVLTPAASMLEGWTYSAGVSGDPGGPRESVDGTAGTSLLLSPDAATTYATSPTFPVIPGQPVMASAYARRGAGAGSLRLQWVDVSTETATDAEVTTIPTSSGPLPRYTAAVASVPAGQHAARIQVRGALLIARPAVTWTTQVQPWGPGQGADKVVLSPLSTSTQYAVLGSHYVTSQYTVQEVG